MKNKIDQVLDFALQRAPMIWEKRKLLINIKRNKKLQYFRAQIQFTAKRAAKKNNIYINKIVTAMKSKGIEVFTIDSSREAAKVIKNKLGGNTAIRSSSRLLNCIEYYCDEYLPNLIQTDIYDYYSQSCKNLNIDYYPRIQTKHEDYEKIKPWITSKRKNKNITSLSKILKGHIINKHRNIFSAVCGANIITTDGKIIIAENTGNIRYLLGMQNVVIAATVDRIVETIEEAFLWIDIPYRHGLIKSKPSFIYVVTAPSLTDTLQGEQTSYGCNSITLVLVKKNNVIFDFPKCTGCGLCALVCPAYEIHGVNYSWNGYAAGRGVIESWEWGGSEEVVNSNPWMCQQCGNCRDICPSKRDICGFIEYIITTKLSTDEIKDKIENEKLLYEMYRLKIKKDIIQKVE